jgi:hypothetical protein
MSAYLEIEGALGKKRGADSLSSCGECGEPSAQKICMFCSKVKLFNGQKHK